MDTKKLRQKILDLAIHGELVPQDPNDEPASVLLDRIRAEKEQLIKEGKIKAPKKSKSAGDTSHYPKDVPFEVPEGWCFSQIGEVLRLVNGRAFKKEELVCQGKYRVLRVGNFFTNDSWYYSDLELDDDKYCDSGDLLYAWSASFGAKIWDNGKAIFHYHIWKVQYDERLFDKRFLYYFLEWDKQTILNSTTGSTMIHVSMENMKPREIVIPPKPEQKRIVSAIEKWDTVINLLERCSKDIQNTASIAKTKILDMAIHGKLVSQDPSDEPATEFLRRINPDFIPSHNLHYLDCPSGWAVTQMKSIIELLSGRDLDNSRCNSEGYGVPYLVGASCIDKGRINTYRWTETPEVISKEGDVLLSCKGTVGEVVLNTMGNLHIARQFMAIRSKAPQYILPDYLGIIIKASIETLKKAARGIIPGISREDILGLTVMIPPSEEQQRILSRIAEFNQSVSLIVANTCN